MKRLLTVALAVLFVSSMFGVAVAERTALSIDGSIEIMGVSEQNIATVLGDRGNDNRVEQKVNLNVDADMTDNVTGHIGLEIAGDWAGANSDINPAAAIGPIDRQRAALAIDEAYITVDELIIEQLSITAGVQTIEYSLRDDGNAMFLSVAETGAFKATLDYDPLYVDLSIVKIDETRATNIADAANVAELASDVDLYALAVEYYLENESKVQFILFALNSERQEISLTEYSIGLDYNFSDDLELFAQIGGQGGNFGTTGLADIDSNEMAYNLGLEYTFSNVNLTPYVGLSYQSFGGENVTATGQDESWVNMGDIDETMIMEADRDLRDHNRGLPKLLTTNYNALRIVGGCVIDEKTTLDGKIVFFSVDDDQANCGAAGGVNLAADYLTTKGENDIGTEIDVKLTHQLTDDLEVGLGIGYVAAGDAIDIAGSGGVAAAQDDDALIMVAANAVLTF